MSSSHLLRETAARLRKAATRAGHAFGAERHRFRIQDPVPESELRNFEAHHGISIPDEYRSFLGSVSRGGAGPAYGLIPFGDGQLPTDAPPTFLSTAFPHQDAFTSAEANSDAEGDLEERPGTLSLCDEGCGYIHFLVCTGPSRGQMWVDCTVSDGGFLPLGVDFLQWFERWLDSVLAGGRGTWWLDRPDDAEAAADIKAMKPWWRRL